MNAREQARFDMIKRVGTFGTNNAGDFPAPVPPAISLALGLFDKLNAADTGLIARIAKNAESQQTGTGTARGGATSKEVLQDALFLELKGINRTAAAIAEAQNNPGIMDSFRMPYSVGDAVLVAKARAIADAAEGRAADFEALGHEPTFVDDLRSHIDAFEGADTTKETGLQTQAGATEGFTPLLKEAMTTVRQLDAIIHNRYKTDAEKMGEWHTASHVERQKKTKKPATPPPPTP
jgi:hypothetical protein